MASVIFLRAANVGGSSVFSTVQLAKILDIVNIGAAGTFVSPRPISEPSIARALPHPIDIVVRPGSEVLDLIKAGPPATPPEAQVFVSVMVGRPTKRPSLPIETPAGRDWALRAMERRGAFVISARRIEKQRGVDLSAILERAYGTRFTTRSWSTMVRIASVLGSI